MPTAWSRARLPGLRRGRGRGNTRRRRCRPPHRPDPGSPQDVRVRGRRGSGHPVQRAPTGACRSTTTACRLPSDTGRRRPDSDTIRPVERRTWDAWGERLFGVVFRHHQRDRDTGAEDFNRLKNTPRRSGPQRGAKPSSRETLLASLAHVRKRSHVDLRLPRLVGCIDDPVAIRRDIRVGQIGVTLKEPLDCVVAVQ